MMMMMMMTMNTIPRGGFNLTGALTSTNASNHHGYNPKLSMIRELSSGRELLISATSSDVLQTNSSL